MREYLLMLIGASLLVAILAILAPPKGLARSLRLLSSLFLICVLLSPLLDILTELARWSAGEAELPWEEALEVPDYRQQLEEALNTASMNYVADLLTRQLEEQFEIPTGDVRCRIEWKTDDGKLLPSSVTVLLSGRGIWKDTAAIESWVSTLLDCPCESALERSGKEEL